MDICQQNPENQLIQLKKEKLAYSPGEYEYGLFPASIHFGGSVITGYTHTKGWSWTLALHHITKLKWIVNLNTRAETIRRKHRSKSSFDLGLGSNWVHKKNDV